MYRTPKMHELILKGVPDQFRGETWILFSGAINEVKKTGFALNVIKSIELCWRKLMTKVARSNFSFLRNHL